MLRQRSTWPLVAVGVVVLVVALFAFSLVQRYRRPLPPPVYAPGAMPTRVAGNPPSLPWPDKGAAAVAIEGSGLIAAHNDDQVRSLASVTKMMTALVILQDHPLRHGEQGPTITVTPEDVTAYHNAVADDESVVEVVAGEQLTQYQLLQGLLIPSANNFAEILARWDAGSMPDFVAKMNAQAQQLGLTRTHYADASGNDPASVGTATEQVALAQQAMSNDVFAEIVALPQADLPVVGTVYNVDRLIGKNGVIGVKTGSSPEAGSCFVFAATATSAGGPVKVFGAVLGLPQLDDAFAATQTLIPAAAKVPQRVQLIASGADAGEVTTAWGDRVPVRTAGDATFVGWAGMAVKATVDASAPAIGAPAGTRVGTVTFEVAGQKQVVPLETTAAVTVPGWRWRTFR